MERAGDNLKGPLKLKGFQDGVCMGLLSLGTALRARAIARLDNRGNDNRRLGGFLAGRYPEDRRAHHAIERPGRCIAWDGHHMKSSPFPRAEMDPAEDGNTKHTLWKEPYEYSSVEEFYSPRTRVMVPTDNPSCGAVDPNGIS